MVAPKSDPLEAAALRAAYVSARAEQLYAGARAEAADTLLDSIVDELAVAARALAAQAGLESALANDTAQSLRKQLKELEHVQ